MKFVPCLLDTSIISAIMKQDEIVLPKAHSYLMEYNQFAFSVVAQYEILRGLKAKQAVKQIIAFENFCKANIILPIEWRVAEKASEIYADLSHKGCLIGDADILIAATALEHNLGLVTNNEKHFSCIEGLYIENWKR